LTNESEKDLSGFFWRQVVARTSETAVPSQAYQNGWNAINQFAREDYSWNGREPNVLHVRRGDRFFDFSGVSGFDFAEDSRAFAVTDFDGDGRPDVILKSRLGPQVRVLQNNCTGPNRSIAFELRGTQSNRDAIGARVRVDGQTKWLDTGSGFLSQHSKTLLFGTGSSDAVSKVEILWPSGTRQEFTKLATGFKYSIIEGNPDIKCERFRNATPLPSKPVTADNSMRLEDTWLQDPVPLPERQPGPGLFVVREAKPEYRVFRRYLFDWRTDLKLPLPVLLNSSGEVVKVYGEMPTSAAVAHDLTLLKSGQPLPCLPFHGMYVHRPKRDFFKFGAAYLWAGDPERALVYLDKVLEQNPDNARVYVLAGQIHFESNRLDEAAVAFRKAIEFLPLSVNGWIGMGDISARKGDPARAAANYGKALELDPDSAEAANGLGLALAKQGNVNDARKYFERAISIRRNYAGAVNNLAVLYSQQGQLNDAIAAWRYGIQVSPDEDILYLNLGRTYVLMGQKDKARVVMQELLDRKPGDLVARRALEELDRR
jgi:Flp pilus assembly protein TadD